MKYLVVTLTLLISSCSIEEPYEAKVGDCLILYSSTYKVIEVGKYSYKIQDKQGQLITIQKNEVGLEYKYLYNPTDCFDNFKENK